MHPLSTHEKGWFLNGLFARYFLPFWLFPIVRRRPARAERLPLVPCLPRRFRLFQQEGLGIFLHGVG